MSSSRKRGSKWIPAFAGMTAVFLSLASAFADTIYYNSGETLKGLVVEEHRDRIVVSTEAGEWTVFRKDIAEVFYDDPERNYVYLGNQALLMENFAAAHGFFRKALQLHPDFRDAEGALNRLADLKKKSESPEREADPVGALQNRWGLTLTSTANGVQIQAVKKGSLAARAGILAQDLLVSAWGESLAFLPLEEVARALLGPPGSPVGLAVQRAVSLAPGVSKKRAWPGWTLSMESLGLTVTAVEPSGAAVKKGIQPQDRIIEIGGRFTRYLPLEEAVRITRDAQKKGLLVVIHRDLLIKRE